MAFSIHQLDKIDPYEDGAEDAFEAYQDALLERFLDSPEGEAHRQTYPEMGFWAAQFMYYGYQYLGASIPKVTKGNAEEIVTELFPRKISLLSPDEADDAIPELVAFWHFLKRAYKLHNADTVLRFLRKIEPDFKDIMNDPSRFGMAKSFIMMGRESGFDMTDEEDLNAFMQLYNANIAESSLGERASGLLPSMPKTAGTKQARAKKKKSRKMAKASRRKARKKRK